MPSGGFYLRARSPESDGWALAEMLTRELGIVGSPGSFYGPAGDSHLRLALVQDVGR